MTEGQLARLHREEWSQAPLKPSPILRFGLFGIAVSVATAFLVIVGLA